MNIAKLSSQFHKWLALIVGVQVFAWVLGGFVMVWYPIEEVRGQHNAKQVEPSALSTQEAILAPKEILTQFDSETIHTITLRRFMDEMVYETRDIEGKYALFDAHRGNRLTPFDEDIAREIAQLDFSGSGKVLSATLIDQRVSEFRGGPLPVWRIIFDDADNTRLYVSPDRGRVLARRNSTWRLFDFFWMLHTMDYQDRDDFNHPLIVIAAAATLIVTISGIILIFFRFRRRDFMWVLPKKNA